MHEKLHIFTAKQGIDWRKQLTALVDIYHKLLLIYIMISIPKSVRIFFPVRKIKWKKVAELPLPVQLCNRLGL